MPTPDRVTELYQQHGLPATTPGDIALAWEDYQQGRGAPVRLLPKNGGTCPAAVVVGGVVVGTVVCGRPLLIDGSCYGSRDHLDVVRAELGEWAAEHVTTEHWDAHGGDVTHRTCTCGRGWTSDTPHCPDGPDADDRALLDTNGENRS